MIEPPSCNDAALRRRVVRLARIAHNANDGGDVDDRAAELRAVLGLVLHHRARDGARKEERALQVDVENSVPVLVGHAHEKTVLRDAGVVDHDVDLAEVRDNGLHARIDLGRNRDIDAVALRLDAKRLKRGDRLGAPLFLEVADCDVCTTFGELLCDGRANSASGACDDCDFAFQVVHDS